MQDCFLKRYKEELKVKQKMYNTNKELDLFKTNEQEINKNKNLTLLEKHVQEIKSIIERKYKKLSRLFHEKIQKFKKQREIDTKSINPKVLKTSNKRIVHLSECSTCNSEKSSFIKEQEPSGLLRKFKIKTPLSKIPLLTDIFI